MQNSREKFSNRLYFRDDCDAWYVSRVPQRVIEKMLHSTTRRAALFVAKFELLREKIEAGCLQVLHDLKYLGSIRAHPRDLDPASILIKAARLARSNSGTALLCYRVRSGYNTCVYLLK